MFRWALVSNTYIPPYLFPTQGVDLWPKWSQCNIQVCGSVSSFKYGEDHTILEAVGVRHIADLERRFH